MITTLLHPEIQYILFYEFQDDLNSVGVKVTYDYPVCSLAQNNPTWIIWSRQGV